MSAKEIRDAFAEGWKVDSIMPSRFEVRPDLKDFTFSEGGPRAWFVVESRGVVSITKWQTPAVSAGKQTKTAGGSS